MQAVVHHDDLVGHGHGLDLVVGDVDRRGLQALVQFLDLGAHLHAQLGIEVGQRLVEQEHLRIAHDGAAHGDALALAAGKLARIAFEQRLEAEDLGGALHPRRRSLPVGAPRSFSEKRHVVGDGHVRIERVVLEHHGDVALFRRQIVDHPVADADFARGDVLKAGDHPQQRRFAAARWADQHDELAIADRNIDAVDDGCRAKSLMHVANCDRSHSVLPPPPAGQFFRLYRPFCANRL